MSLVLVRYMMHHAPFITATLISEILEGAFTLEVLGSEKYGSEMMLFNKASDLWRYLRPVPSHDQSLTNCPSPQSAKAPSPRVCEFAQDPGTYQSRSCHSGSRSPSPLAISKSRRVSGVTLCWAETPGAHEGQVRR